MLKTAPTIGIQSGLCHGRGLARTASQQHSLTTLIRHFVSIKPAYTVPPSWPVTAILTHWGTGLWIQVGPPPPPHPASCSRPADLAVPARESAAAHSRVWGCGGRRGKPAIFKNPVNILHSHVLMGRLAAPCRCILSVISNCLNSILFSYKTVLFGRDNTEIIFYRKTVSVCLTRKQDIEKRLYNVWYLFYS